MRNYATSLMATVASTLVALAQTTAPPVISPSQANGHRGETVTVCGRPAGFVCSKDGTAFNFPDPNGALFRVEILKANRRQFGLRLEDRFGQRNVCATGQVEPFGTSNQIVVTAVDNFVLEKDQPPPVPVFGPTAYRPDCDPDVMLPTLKRAVKPNYTAEALAAGISGKVGLRGVVETNGRVGDVIVIRSIERGLDIEAARAAKQFEFEPGTLDGIAVPVVVAFEIEFSIKSK